MITAGTAVMITDASGEQHETEALSGVEATGHSFPVVWVNRPLYVGGFEPMPWPADSVELIDRSAS